MNDILEGLAIAGVVIGAFCLVLSGFGRLMLWLTRSDTPPPRNALNPFGADKNPYQAVLASFSYMLRPAILLVAIGAAAAVLRAVSELAHGLL